MLARGNWLHNDLSTTTSCNLHSCETWEALKNLFSWFPIFIVFLFNATVAKKVFISEDPKRDQSFQEKFWKHLMF